LMPTSKYQLPKLCTTSRRCLFIDGRRKLEHGVYTTSFEAATKAASLVGQRLFSSEQITIGRVWVSR
jgi:hypothetical protein